MKIYWIFWWYIYVYVHSLSKESWILSLSRFGLVSRWTFCWEVRVPGWFCWGCCKKAGWMFFLLNFKHVQLRHTPILERWSKFDQQIWGWVEGYHCHYSFLMPVWWNQSNKQLDKAANSWVQGFEPITTIIGQQLFLDPDMTLCIHNVK